MKRQPHVIVHAPDNRGLRAVSVEGETVGKAWSIRELRKILRRSGVARDIDLDNPGQVRWTEDKTSWPDRPWRRRATAVLMALGLLISAAVLFRVGLADAFRALTFGGRVMGVVFLAGSLMEVVAAIAVFDYWGKRAVKFSGQGVLLGVVTMTVTSVIFLALQWEGGDYTRLLWLWVGLVIWSAWALWELSRKKVWQGIRYPKSFALGVALSAVVGAASLAYSAMYVPYAAPVKVPFRVAFGKPTASPDRISLYVPARITFRNSGSVRIFVVGTLWTAKVWPTKFTEKGNGMEEWKGGLSGGYWVYRHENFTTSRMLGAEQEPYGMKTMSTFIEEPIAVLLQAADD